MIRFEERVSRLEPNTETTKILKNVDIKFKERMYLDFNLEIKRVIKLAKNIVNLYFFLYRFDLGRSCLTYWENLIFILGQRFQKIFIWSW